MLNALALGMLRDQGYVIVPDIALDDALKAAHNLGDVTVDKRNPYPVRRISPQSIPVAKENTLSSRYGSGRFPFHTDAAHWRHPPEFVCLYCEEPGSGSRPTELIDTSIWRIEHGLRVLLLSSIWKTGYVRPWLCTVATEVDHTIRVRYDVGCMEPMGRNSVSTKVALERLIDTCSKVSVHWVSRSLLVINNLRMLHARGSSTQADSDRVLARILVGGNQ